MAKTNHLPPGIGLGQTPVVFESHVVRTGSIAGARADFETMVHCLVDEELGDARRFDDKQGDWGIDAYRGQLTSGPIQTWQAKYFSTGIGESQKSQIRTSFRALKNAIDTHGIEPTSWVLVTNASLTPKATTWWEGWVRRNQELGVDIDLWDGPRLCRLLDRAPETRRRFYERASARAQPSRVSWERADVNMLETLVVDRRPSVDTLRTIARRSGMDVNLVGVDGSIHTIVSDLVADALVDAEVAERFLLELDETLNLDLSALQLG